METKTERDSFKTLFNHSQLGIVLPLAVDSNNYFVLRFNGERLASNTSGLNKSSDATLNMYLLGIGWQHKFNEKFTVLVLALPKIASDLEDKLGSEDLQFGGSFLINYKLRKNQRYKFGLYYNREPFGNFFVPLLGADVQLGKKDWIYGQLPLFFRYEHQFSQKIYSGLGMRFFGRSYRLGSDLNDNYAFVQENQFKVFTDYYLTKTLVLFGEIGRTVGYGFKNYKQGPRTDRQQNPLAFRPVKDGFFFNLGVCYRVRADF